MATNTKHIDSIKYGKALTLKDRIEIEKIISTNRERDGSMKITLNAISDMLEKDPTTISKEVKFRRTPLNTRKPTNLAEMKFFIEKYSKQFPFCRVDFIESGGAAYFCEFTFIKSGGIGTLGSKELNQKLGRLIDIDRILIKN